MPWGDVGCGGRRGGMELGKESHTNACRFWFTPGRQPLAAVWLPGARCYGVESSALASALDVSTSIWELRSGEWSVCGHDI